MIKTLASMLSRLADLICGVTKLRRDLVLHALAGIPVAIYGAGLGLAAMRAEINMVAACTFVAGLTFAITKELADHFANLDAIARGEAPPHGVDIWDGAFSLLASALLAASVQAMWR